MICNVTLGMTSRRFITADFTYFGLKFIQHIFNVPDNVDIVDLDGSEIKSNEKDSWRVMMCEIDSDITSLNMACFGANSKSERNDTDFDHWSRNGDFVKSDSTLNLFYYRHTTHVTFSHLYLSQWISAGVRLPRIEYNVSSCEESTHRDRHFQLLPFFRDNRSLKLEFQKARNVEDSDFLRSALTKLESGVFKDSEFVAGTERKDAWNYDENDWTTRLKFCLAEIYPMLHIQQFAARGMEATEPYYFDVYEPLSIFPLHGAIDLVATKKAILISAQEGEAQNHSPMHKSLEITQQRHPMKGKDTLPEKLGELIASLYFLLVCRVIRYHKSGAREIYSVYGTLIDRMVGGIEVELCGGMNTSICIKRISFNLGDLSVQRLCSVLEHLLSA